MGELMPGLKLSPESAFKAFLWGVFALVAGVLGQPAHAQIMKADDASFENLEHESRMLVENLAASGLDLSDAELKQLETAWATKGKEGVGAIQDVLDKHCWFEVRVDDEAWLTLNVASSRPQDRPLMQGKWTSFLVKIYNLSDAQSEINVRSGQALSAEELAAVENGNLTTKDAPDAWYRWLSITKPSIGPSSVEKRYPGVSVRYRVVKMISRDQGLRAADIEFFLDGGAVSQGHYTNRRVLFDVAAAQTE